MPKYVLGHHLKGEGARLELMSELLDPMHRQVHRCTWRCEARGAHT
jgi:hypothetical protein